MPIPDNYDMFCAHQDRQDKEMERLPTCCECDRKITGEKLYYFDGEIFCQQCLIDYHEKDTEDFIE